MSIQTLGIENDKTLYIFDAFKIDKGLPKWKSKELPKGKIAIERADNGQMFVPGLVGTDEYLEPDRWDDSAESRAFLARAIDPVIMFNNPRGSKGGFKQWFAELWRKQTEVPVEKVFESILMTMSELKIYEERQKEIEMLLRDAVECGQRDLYRELLKKKSERSFENVLFAKGYTKYVTEQQLLQFSAKCERGLCLDWIENFARVIPKEVIEAKRKADTDHLFDNYVILHYDPENKATTPEARKKEEVKRKDPILFGVIKESRNLYFVADWKDELCTLTLQDIITVLGTDLEIK